MTQRYLFQASIGPVQTFIASARRTRDLWFGSWLLSELSKAAARAVVDLQGQLIFPAPTSTDDLEPGSVLNVANKIVATIDRPPPKVGGDVQAAVKEQLHALWKEVRAQIGDLEDDSAALAQIDALAECVWAAVPLGDDYTNARARLEALITARKTTRDFGKVTWGGAQPKSSISGQMESVIPEGHYPHHKASPEQKAAKVAALRHNYGAGPAERLSAIDLLKRHGRGQERFLSTSHVAALPFLARLHARAGDTGLQQIWGDYLAELKRQNVRIEDLPGSQQPLIGDCDGAMLFEDRLDAEVADVAILQLAKQCLRNFLRECGAHPSPYYAILHADGDGMGGVIDHEAWKGDERHREISRQLDAFATEAAKTVKQQMGTPIYTGGDDVLALLPLHTALQCAKELAERFKELMNGFADKQERHPTLSVGLAVVHHLIPLSDALDLARDAEKTAKRVKVKGQNGKVQEKNALAITVSKRSGGDTAVCGQWGAFDAQLKQVIELHRKGYLPDGTAYELRDLAYRMENALPAEALRLEALRILKRKQMPEDARKQLQDILIKRIPNDMNRPDKELASFADGLIVARLFADARNLALLEANP
ncbi:MAG: type III-B CRISPR-associated protein Cas10/Cmr2 [Chloroflexales bacterium]|nr:type III-B CRISPR-associated protein Cas10/Cmr2 [Chloroflexales bacterium]